MSTTRRYDVKATWSESAPGGAVIRSGSHDTIVGVCDDVKDLLSPGREGTKTTFPVITIEVVEDEEGG